MLDLGEIQGNCWVYVSLYLLTARRISIQTVNCKGPSQKDNFVIACAKSMFDFGGLTIKNRLCF